MGGFTDFCFVVSPFKTFTVYVKIISKPVRSVGIFLSIKQFYRVIIGIPDYKEQIVKIMSLIFINEYIIDPFIARRCKLKLHIIVHKGCFIR